MPLWKADRSAADLATRWGRPPSTFIELDGMLVHVRDEGPRDAPAIVLLHGTGNSLHTWEGWAERLRDSYRVVSLDRPGFGLTGPNPTGDYSMAYYAGFVGRFFDALQIARCTLAGNSAGGNVAWHTALAHPERVERLVLLASSGYPRTTKQSFGFRVAKSPAGPFLMHVLSRDAVDKNVRGTYGDPAKLTQATLDRSYAMTLRAGNREALGATLRQAEAIDDSASIASIATPTLILWGTKDWIVPPSEAKRFERDIEGSRLVMLPGVGHLPQEEEPDGSVAALKAFLAETAA